MLKLVIVGEKVYFPVSENWLVQLCTKKELDKMDNKQLRKRIVDRLAKLRRGYIDNARED